MTINSMKSSVRRVNAVSEPSASPPTLSETAFTKEGVRVYEDACLQFQNLVFSR